jgi:hypothetical protein
MHVPYFREPRRRGMDVSNDETRKGFWIDEECAVHGVEIKEP